MVTTRQACRSLSILLFLGLCSCGLTAETPGFKNIEPECDAPCGLCGLGRYSCDEKACLQGLDGMDESRSCSESVVFVDVMKSASLADDQRVSSSLEEALTIAQREDIQAIVVLGAPEFQGPVELIDGVSLFGGYDLELNPSEDRPSIATTQEPSEGPKLGVHGSQLVKALSVNKMIIKVSDSTTGPVIGGLFRSILSLTLRDVSITAGAGVDGADGSAGNSGDDGPAGKAYTGGGTPVETLNDACLAATGGRGGFGFQAQRNVPPEAGQRAPAGAMGGAVESDGSSGDDGEDGQPGTDAQPWEFSDGIWSIARETSSGRDGTPGGGGGGGGGSDAANQEFDGISGGSGGAGGCGGEGGQAGLSGAPSVGVLIDGSNVLLEQAVSIVSGKGGRAGRGGDPGQGGAGGRGGVDVLNRAGNGGDGGDGGDGGKGGDGVAGPSYGIYCAQPLKVSVANQEDVVVSAGGGGVEVNGDLATSQDISSDCTLAQP